MAKVEKNIDKNANVIGGHMKRKAAFFFVFCMSLLLLAGLEVKSEVMPQYGYMIVTILSVIGAVLFLLGRWMFYRYRMVVLSIAIYAVVFIMLYFTSITASLYELSWLKDIDDKMATCSFLLVVSVPILWQLFLIWVYSKLYRGFMQEKISKEAYIYGKAYIAYKIKDMAALPQEYEVVARDFVAPPSSEEDISLNSLNTILVGRLDELCEPPVPIKVFWSWVKYNFRGRHNREAEYIERHGFDYETMRVNESGTIGNDVENVVEEDAPAVEIIKTEVPQGEDPQNQSLEQ